MKKIVILGSTGSIGKSLLRIINRDKNSFNIKLLTAKKNHLELFRQAKNFKVKNVILTDKKIFDFCKKKFRQNNIKIFNNYKNLNKILSSKVDYTMCSIVGIDGLSPTYSLIKHTNNIAIANKESIICGWNLIIKELKKYKTRFIPVDSEHFSIWFGLKKNLISSEVNKIYLTASGGPLLNIPIRKFNKLKIADVIKHPNWNMGKKISVDSATMINKVFEIIEAKKIFGLNYNQLDILIHPDSYIHSIIEFKNKMISIIAHETTMDIPIYNSLYLSENYDRNNYFSILNLEKINKTLLKKVDIKRYPLVKIINLLTKNDTLFETGLVAANDELVDLYLRKKIKFNDISTHLIKILKSKEFLNLKKKYPKNLSDILRVNQNVRITIKNKFN